MGLDIAHCLELQQLFFLDPDSETGIGFDERCLSPHKADGGVSTASSVQVRRPINRSGVGTWRRYADELAPLLRALQADGFVDADGEAIWPAR